MSGAAETRDPEPGLADPGEEVRYRLLRRLDPGDAAGRTMLLGALGDPSWRVRAAAVGRLSLGGAALAQELVDFLAPGGTAGRRNAAAGALARIGPPAVPALVRALESGGAELRTGAAEVLGHVGDPAAAGPLAARLADADPNVRAAAAGALGGVRGPVAAAALHGALAGSEPGLRLAALEALAHLGQAPPFPRLAALAAEGATRRPALRLLGLCDEPGAVALLAEALGDRSRSVREAALTALAAQRKRNGRAALAPAGAAVRAAAAADPVLADRCAEVLEGLGEGPALGPVEFRQLRDRIEEHCGVRVRDELSYLMERRLGPRLGALGLPDFAAYHRHLRLAPDRREELDTAAELLTTHETYFFREPRQLRAFSEEILPRLARENGRARRLRVWSAGCSTGEEPYTIAILLLRSGLFPDWDLEVTGTDLARRVLAVAEAGRYGERAFRGPDAEELRPWFEAGDGKWSVREEVRRRVRFARSNLLDRDAEAAPERVDLLFCRNVLIYFDLEARRRVLRTFHRRLRPGGFLLLGHSESLMNLTADFELVHLRQDLVYRKPAGAEALP